MTRTRSILGALLLSALAVCAFGAASASALTAHECKTGGGGTGVKYTDATCSVQSAEGTFETVKITGKQKVEATLTPTTAGMNVTAGEEAGTHLVLHAVLGGISVQITCTGASSPGAEAENSGTSISGEAKGKFTGCAISNSAIAKENCQIPATLETVAVSGTTEEDKVVLKPKEGTKFGIIPFTSKAGKTCPAAILGEKEVTGTAKGVAAGPTAIEFTSTSGSELKLGGVAAQLTAVTHVATAGGGNTIGIETP